MKYCYCILGGERQDGTAVGGAGTYVYHLRFMSKNNITCSGIFKNPRLKTRDIDPNVNHGFMKVVRTTKGKANLSLSHAYDNICIKWNHLSPSVVYCYPVCGEDGQSLIVLAVAL